MTNSDIADEERPTPPCAGGRRRYAGTHAFRPHHPNKQQAFMKVTATVIETTDGSKIAPRRPRAAVAASRQIGGSSTCCWIQTVKSAGSTPTKNTPRHPQIGIT